MPLLAPTVAIAPSAVTWQSQHQYLAPVGQKVYTTVSHGPAIVKSTPIVAAAPVLAAHGLATPLVHGYGLGAPLALGHGLAGPAVYGAPLLY